jgi:hypothetical protein
VNRQLHAPSALPLGNEPLVLIESEADCALQPALTLQRREKSLAHAGNLVYISDVCLMCLQLLKSSAFSPVLNVSVMDHSNVVFINEHGLGSRARITR